MESPAMPIRGLINDLTRTLTGSIVHMDNLLLHLDNDSREFEEAWLANHQLSRALEFFIELRSEYMMQQDSVKQNETKFYQSTAFEKLSHNLNNLLLVAQCYFDAKKTDVRICSNIVDNIYNSIQNLYSLLNGTICLPESNIAMSRLPDKRKKSLNVSKNKIKVNNRILLVEDDKGVNKVIRSILRKHKYTVVECFNGEKAVAIFEHSKESFALHIVDIGLPDIKGPDLVNNLLLQKPDINILFISGYNETKLKKQYPLLDRYPILIKPFLTEKLLHIMELIVIH